MPSSFSHDKACHSPVLGASLGMVKCSALFEHVYENYQDHDTNTYAIA